MNLSELAIGQIAKIISMQKMQPSMRKKLLNLGFLPQAQVQLLRVAPMGDPMIIRCANSSIALRKDLLKQIMIEVQV